MNLGEHADFIIASFALAIATILALIAWVTFDFRTQLRILGELEQRGVTRRSRQPNKTEP
ncbi:MAG: heme exporter protein CcmD [Bradyrhizobium sp.]|uniref:heme exporter protein CcmD n=1 Tax=Bradyrhizobium sp. TaxID=376 RepID=UPI0012208ECA|nr:heme exporter protein CcmD [Bradyrhizobium sp.]THD63341.1 MAG: heme exporter protein CcmD [Bradyrhizobium sp.]